MNLPGQAYLAIFLLIGSLPAFANRPNVLIVVADDLGWGDLSSHGNREIETPHLDTLKEEGLSFEKFYSCPNGSTSSASLLTGRYHYRTGVVGERGSESVMYESETTLAELFRENGYETALFGRWHHGINWPHRAEAQGFAIHRDDDSRCEDAIAFTTEKRDAPFFCLLHFPYPRVEEKETSDDPEDQLDIVYERVAKLDSETGRLLAELDGSGIRENTIVIFLSDNGPDQFGETRGRYNNFFYGGKGSVHEGGVRVPCFVSWTGKIEAGSRFTRIVSLIDWFPTLAELCDLEADDRQLPLDGRSLGAVLRNGGTFEDWPNRVLFTSWTPPGYAIKKGSYAARTDRWVALRDERWRRDQSIVEKRSGWELYDLNTDPFQSHDMGDEHPFLLSELKADFMFWLDHTTDDGIGPIPTEFGHPEGPVVILESNPEKRWPISVIRPATYRVEATFSGNDQSCQIGAGEERIEMPGQTNLFLGEAVNEIRLLSGEVSSLRFTLEKE